MALTGRNGVWHGRKIVRSHTFTRSTKAGDKKLAEQISALWKAEAIREVVLKGAKPVLLHADQGGDPKRVLAAHQRLGRLRWSARVRAAAAAGWPDLQGVSRPRRHAINGAATPRFGCSAAWAAG